MGYYSEVALCLTKETNQAMLEALEKENAEVQIEAKSLLGDAEKHEHEEAVLYYWAWIKWYSSYPCVGFIERFLANIDNEDETNLDYKLVHVGENIADINEEGDYYDNPFNICSVQTISYDVPVKN